jgi:hypothetical protein
MAGELTIALVAGGTDRSGVVLVRMDSAFFTYDALAPVLTHNAYLSVTARMNLAVTAALSRITESTWTDSGSCSSGT